MKHEPKIGVGLVDRQTVVRGLLDGYFLREGIGLISGPFSATVVDGKVVVFDQTGREITRSPSVALTGQQGSSFSLFDVLVGSHFHWERREDQTYSGDLVLKPRADGTIAAINEVPLEDYLASVVASEMSPSAPTEFLKAHAIVSRSWLLSGLQGKREKITPAQKISEEEVLLWYERREHDLYDVCADEHCQRYQGTGKKGSKRAEQAVRETRGIVIASGDEICDARYSKACGGLTETFSTAWDDRQIPYLVSISDAPVRHRQILTEEEASAWIFSDPAAFCNVKDEDLLEEILPENDRQTKNFFRWKTEYSRKELETILLKKSGIDFGSLQEILPLRRGPSGRIFRLKIVGAKRSVVVGKELEIRRWLSRSHLYSSAFVVRTEADRFVFYGAGWGHGVGLCQIGAAVMAKKGFSAEKILKHYFLGAEIKKIY